MKLKITPPPASAKTLTKKSTNMKSGRTKNPTILSLLAIQLCLFVSVSIGQNPELLKEISSYEGSNPSNFTLYKDKVYFSAVERTDFRNYLSSLWVSDGTPAGTIRVKACNPSMRFEVQPFVIANNLMFFIGSDPINGKELWVSDGTESGTKMLKNLNPSGDTRFEELIAFKDHLYFGANDGTNDALWISDGTKDGTVKLRDFPHANSAYIRPTAFVVFDNRLFFHFDDTNNYSEFWETDGTVTGTKRLNIGQDFRGPAGDFKKYKDKIVFGTGSDIKVLTKDSIITLGQYNAGACLSAETQIAIFRDTLYFQGAENQLYSSDGTKDGTKKILSSMFLCRFLEANNQLYFVSSNLSPMHLWTTDGTKTGTKPVAQNSTYEVGYQASDMFIYKNMIYFIGLKLPIFQSKLFVFNPLLDTAEPFISIDSESFYAFNYFIANGLLYFKGPIVNQLPGPGPYSNYALWKTDGTVAGTSSVSPLNINDGARNYDFLYNANDLLFFSNSDHSYWYTDGTQDNTVLIRPPGVERFLGSQYRVNILYKDYFIFRGNFTESNNEELWVLKLKDITTNTEALANHALNKIALYPNPTQNTLQINDFRSAGTYTIELYNLLGNRVAQFFNVQSHQSLPIDQLSNGVYWAKISNNHNEWTTKKFIITN